ncbi:MAG: hypothetical protein MI724_07280, partial [Spirochaetales bacterium]|nr:hypothetical protein [Spirochaetales bacterium]
ILAVAEVLEERVNANLFYVLEHSLAEHNDLFEMYAPRLHDAAGSEQLLWLLTQPEILHAYLEEDLRHIVATVSTQVLEQVVNELGRPLRSTESWEERRARSDPNPPLFAFRRVREYANKWCSDGACSIERDLTKDIDARAVAIAETVLREFSRHFGPKEEGSIVDLVAILWLESVSSILSNADKSRFKRTLDELLDELRAILGDSDVLSDDDLKVEVEGVIRAIEELSVQPLHWFDPSLGTDLAEIAGRLEELAGNDQFAALRRMENDFATAVSAFGLSEFVPSQFTRTIRELPGQIGMVLGDSEVDLDGDLRTEAAATLDAIEELSARPPRWLYPAAAADLTAIADNLARLGDAAEFEELREDLLAAAQGIDRIVSAGVWLPGIDIESALDTADAARQLYDTIRDGTDSLSDRSVIEQLNDLIQADFMRAWELVFQPLFSAIADLAHLLEISTGESAAPIALENAIENVNKVAQAIEPHMGHAVQRIEMLHEVGTLDRLADEGEIDRDDIVYLAYVAVGMIDMVETLSSRRAKSRNKDRREHRSLDQMTTVLLAAAQIVEAQDEATAIATILDDVLLPPVSFATKRQGGIHVLMSAFAGFTAPSTGLVRGVEDYECIPVPHVPLGLEVVWANRRMGTRRTLSTPLGVLLSPVDFAGPLSERIRRSADNENGASDWRFEDLFVPSITVAVGLPELPLVFGFSGRLLEFGDSLEFALSLTAAFDVPLFQLF